MRKKQLYFLILFLAVVCLSFWAQHRFEPRPLAEMETKQITLAGAVVTVRVAATEADQERGLMGVSSLRDDEGMLFPFTPAGKQRFWNEGMLMPFDLLWVRNDRVVGIEKQFPAYAGEAVIKESPGAVGYVLELKGGWSDRHGLRVGDLILGL